MAPPLHQYPSNTVHTAQHTYILLDFVSRIDHLGEPRHSYGGRKVRRCYPAVVRLYKLILGENMRNNTLIRNEKTASLFLTVDDPNRTTLAQSFKPFKNRLKSLFFIYHKKTQFKEVGNSKIFRQKKKQYLLRFIPL